MQVIVQAFDEIQCALILAAVFIAMPEDQIADGVHPQTVKMIAIDPESRCRHQETAHGFFPQIKIGSAPL